MQWHPHAHTLDSEVNPTVLCLDEGGVDMGFALQLLGPVRLSRHGVAVRGLESRKALALLCHLAVEGSEVGRARLADLFWGQMPEAKGRANLSRVVHNLAHVVPGSLVADRHAVALGPSIEHRIDTAAFDALAGSSQVGTLTAATDLYRGELMSDLFVDDCPEYELWLVRQREAWHRRVTMVLERLLQLHLDAGNCDSAEQVARRLIALDPWREEAHRALMRLLADCGQRCAALVQYEICRGILATDLGAGPAPETSALAARIRGADSATGDPRLLLVAPAHALQLILHVSLASTDHLVAAMRLLEEALARMPGAPEFGLSILPTALARSQQPASTRLGVAEARP